MLEIFSLMLFSDGMSVLEECSNHLNISYKAIKIVMWLFFVDINYIIYGLFSCKVKENLPKKHISRF